MLGSVFLLLSRSSVQLESVGYGQGVCATTAPLGLSCMLVVVVVHRNHGITGPLEEEEEEEEDYFRSVSAHRPLAPMSEVHGVFSSRNLLSTSQGKPRPIAGTCNVLGVFWTSLANNTKEGFSFFMLGILSLNFCSCGRHC